MPWKKRSRQSVKIGWVVGGVVAVAMASLIGYEWGNTASVVGVVEKHLADSEAQVRRLEKRVHALESKLGLQAAEMEAKAAAKLN